MGTAFLRSKLSVAFLLSLLYIANGFPFAAASNARVDNNRMGDSIIRDRIVTQDEILDAKALLVSLGVPEKNLCRSSASANSKVDGDKNDNLLALPLCDKPLSASEIEDIFEAGREQRFLEEEEEIESFADDPVFFVLMACSAVGCVCMAALAAGLTMGMLSLDPLMLLVKIRASRSQEEKRQAESLLPVVKQHHLLLVTLLLLNSLANEALPLFLEKLVSPVVSVLLSVTFILIFGEILPSAIFTGPKKLELASKMVPLVKFVMALLWPICFPIAKVLDKVLHEEEDSDGAFDRGEISALVRIQYEERLANKRARKLEKMDYSIRTTKRPSGNFPGPKRRPPDLETAIKAVKAQSIRNLDEEDPVDASTRSFDAISNLKFQDVQSIHVDEVMMVEGALQMKTKTAMQVFTPIHRLFAVPCDLILNERNVVDIYSSGYSRVPVFERNPLKPKSQATIKGILNTKNLIVVNMNENRALSTMPLLTPPCVSPKMNLIELVNLFQTGRDGHFALVCARPLIGTQALKEGKALPEAAALMGVVTLEDVLEELLQEEIFDEKDQTEKEAAEKIALWAGRRWRRNAKHVKSMASVVEEATRESTALLGNPQEKRVSVFESIFQGLRFSTIDE